MKKTNKHTIKFFIFGLSFILFVFFQGCKSGPKIEEFLVGSWRSYKRKVHSIITFHNNGSWVIERRVEGKLSKIVAKRGKISGEWFYTDNIEGLIPEDEALSEEDVEEIEDMEDVSQEAEGTQKIYLVLKVLEKEDDDDYWRPESINIFEIVLLNKDKLSIQDLDGKVFEWDRVRAEKGDDELAEGSLAVDMGTIIVNLRRVKVRQKRRYLCLNLDMVLEVPIQEGAIMPEAPKLHPRLREAAIFYLSSLTYKDIKSIDRVQEHIIKLKDILNPYAKGTIQELRIKNVVVTSEKSNVEDFINQIIKPQEIEEAVPAEDDDDDENGEELEEG